MNKINTNLRDKKKLRFEGFNDKLETYTLKDITYKMESGGTPKSSNKTYYDGNIPFLSISDISGNKLYKTKKFISESGLSNSSTKIIKENNIIYTMYATPGIAFLNHIDVAIPQSVISIELKDNFNTLFVLNLLNFYRNNILSLAMTGTQSNLTGEIVKNIKVKIPSIEEQNKVENLLSSIDILIEKQNMYKNYLINYKKSICNIVFTKFLKKSKLVELDYIATIKKGEQLNKVDMIDNGKYFVFNGGLKESGMSNLFNEENNITISEGGNSCGYIRYIKGKFWSGGHNYTLKDLKVNEEYLFQFLKFNEKKIQNLRIGSGIPNIQLRDLKNFKISMPILEDQILVANLLSSMDNFIKIYYLYYKKYMKHYKYFIFIKN